MTTAADDTEIQPRTELSYVGELASALRNPRRRDQLTVLRRPHRGGGWSSPADLARIASLAKGRDLDQCLAVGAAWMRWHAASTEPHYGRTGTSIGRAMRQIGSSSAGYGPSNPRAQNALSALLAADDYPTLTAALVGAVNALSAAEWPPHWETLWTDISEWNTPTGRDTVRVRWAQDFNTSTPRSAGNSTTED